MWGKVTQELKVEAAFGLFMLKFTKMDCRRETQTKEGDGGCRLMACSRTH